MQKIRAGPVIMSIQHKQKQQRSKNNTKHVQPTKFGHVILVQKHSDTKLGPIICIKKINQTIKRAEN